MIAGIPDPPDNPPPGTDKPERPDLPDFSHQKPEHPTPLPPDNAPTKLPNPNPSRDPVILRVDLEIPGLPTATSPLDVPPNDVPAIMQGRFNRDSQGRIVMKGGKPGTPRPTDETENAVLRGLNWLRDHQNEDGSWGEKNKGGMTGLALLCFLGHGELGNSPNYGLTVNKALNWVIAQGTTYQSRLSMTEDGWGPGNGGVYEHGILTYALAEYYTLSKDERPLELLAKAIGYIVAGQGPDGGWMYRYDKTQSDTSVSGWQVQALKAAHLTKLGLPGVDTALDRAMLNFDRVQGPNGGYGYRTPGDRYSLTGVGVLCEYFWKEKRDADLRRSVDFILNQSAQQFPVEYQHETADLYAWYYHTQALLMFGGGAWVKWEGKLRPTLVKAQASDGSWPVMRAPAHGNLQNDPNLTGAVYRTALSVLTLESYYRYLPLNQASNSADAMRLAVR
jgi:hypothetical protein